MEKFLFSMENLDKTEEQRQLSLFYELLGSWDSETLKSQEVPLGDLISLGQNFGELAEKYEQNSGIIEQVADSVSRCCPVSIKRRVL